MSRASQRNALLIQHCYSPYRTTQFEKTTKKRQKGPVLARKGPFGDFRSPRRAPGDQIWSQLPAIGLPGLDSWSPLTLTWYWVPSGPPGAQKGPILAQMSQISMALFFHCETFISRRWRQISNRHITYRKNCTLDKNIQSRISN